jgi:LuxR family transcriptional regulator, maltose regulon positive regulatory protein
VPAPRHSSGSYDMPHVPPPNLRAEHRRHLSELIERATRRRVALLCAPAGAGKTVACTHWAAATSRKVAWVTLDAEDDQSWFWALVCSGLERACEAPANALRALQDESPSGFPLLLAHEAQHFTESVVIILDNVHRLTDDVVLTGLDLLICHAPVRLGFLLSGRRRPMLNLERLLCSRGTRHRRSSRPQLGLRLRACLGMTLCGQRPLYSLSVTCSPQSASGR